MKYQAFISYSHSADSRLAPGIERALEQFAKPAFRRRALSLFRDSNDLSASPDLWGKIQSALADSHYFIFLASPAAAASKWCRKEIDFWKASKPRSNFLVVLTAGELAWDEDRNDFDWQKTSSLPDNLSGVFDSEPLYVDFRDLPASLTLDDPDFTSKIVLLAATLHGRSVGDMVGEDVRQHKRTLRIRNGAIAVLSILFVATATLSVFALQQKAIAERQTEEALKQANRALARSFLSSARAQLNTNPTLSVRLAEHAYRFAEDKGLPLNAYEGQLIASFYADSEFYLSPEDLDATAGAVHASGYPVLDINSDPRDKVYRPQLHTSGRSKLLWEDRRLFLLEEDDTRQELDLPSFEYASVTLTSYSFSPRGHYVVTAHRHHQNAGQYFDVLTIFDRRGNKLCEFESRSIFGDAFFYPPAAVFSADETRFLIFGRDTGVSVYDRTAKEMKQTVLHSGGKETLDIDLTADGRLAAYATNDGAVHVQRLGADGIADRWQLTGHASEPVRAVSFSVNGRYLYSASDSFHRRWNAVSTGQRKYVSLKGGPPTHRTTEVDGNRIVETLAAKGRMIFMPREGDFDLEFIGPSGARVAQFTQPNSSHSLSWTSPDGRYVATRNGLFNSERERLVSFNERRTAYKTEIFVIGFSSDSKHFFMIDRLLFLDADTILSRLNDEKLFGRVAELLPADLEKY